MTESYLGEIRTFAFGFAPRGWLTCDGQLLPIPQFSALFALLGTTYGGDGVHTFALPDLRGRVGAGIGSGPGLPAVMLGQAFGVESVALQPAQVPSHTHGLNAVADLATTPHPAGALPAAKGRGGLAMFGPAGSNTTTLAPAAVASAGGGQAHDNLQPYQVLNVCIATQDGIFPTRQ